MARIGGAQVRTKGVDAAPGWRWDLERRWPRAWPSQAEVHGGHHRSRRDLVVDGSRRFAVKNGHPLMSRVVGTGCMAASLIGTFAAVSPDLAQAAAAALVTFGVAAEGAAPRPRARRASRKSCLIAFTIWMKRP